MAISNFFVPCSAEFISACGDRSALKSWKLLVDINADDVLEDITNLIYKNTLQLSGKMEGANGEAISNSGSVQLYNIDNTYEEGDLAGVACAVEAQIGTSNEYIRVFTGFLNKRGVSRNVTCITDNVIQLDFFDYAKKASINAKTNPAIYIGYTIHDSTATATSLFHQLAFSMGMTGGQLDASGILNYQKAYLPLDNKGTIWNELQSLSQQYLGFLGFRYDGKLRFNSRLMDDWAEPASEWTFNATNIHSIKGYADSIICNKVWTEFDKYQTLPQQILYKNVTEYNATADTISINVLTGAYWPGPNSGDRAKLQYKDPSSGEDFPIGINIQTPTIGAVGSGSDLECSGGNITLYSFNSVTGLTQQYPNGSEIILKNNTAGTITLKKLNIRGTPIRVVSKARVEDTDATITNDYDYVEKQIPGKYAVNDTQAHLITQWWMDFGKSSKKTWEITTDWLPQIQVGAYATLNLPALGITSQKCIISAYDHPAVGGPMSVQKTNVLLLAAMDFTPTGTAVVTDQQSGDATVEGARKFQNDLNGKASLSQIINGFDTDGGTTTPAVPIILHCKPVANKAIQLKIDKQYNLTNWDRYEWQVSDDATGWYDLAFDGEGTAKGWGDTLGNLTEWYSELLLHPNIPNEGTLDDPIGKRLYYKCRRVTFAEEASAWSSIASATTQVISAGDIAANAIYANNIIASEIETILLRTSSLYIGYTGTGTIDAPDEGDTVHYVDGSSDQYLEYTGGNWVNSNGIVIGLLGLLIGCGGLYHPSNPPTSDEYLPHPDFRVFNFENNYQDQNGLDDWTDKDDLAFDSTTKKFGTYSLRDNNTNSSSALKSPNPCTRGESFSTGFWFNLSFMQVGLLSTTRLFNLIFNSSTDFIAINLSRASPFGNPQLYYNFAWIAKKANVFYNLGYQSLSANTWYYCAVSYDKDTDILYSIVNNILTTTQLSGVWGGSATEYAYFYPAFYSGGYVHRVSIDEVLFFHDKYLDPNYLTQHYTHNVPWVTGISKLDILLRPGVDGRVYTEAPIKTTNGYQNALGEYNYSWHKVVNPSTDYFYQKTSGWTANAWVTVDFSSIVTAGTKAIRCFILIFDNSDCETYSRKYGDTNVSSTPSASKEYSHIIIRQTSSVAYVLSAVVDIWLSSDYKADFAKSVSGNQWLKIAYPIAELR
jgi:hypothetical protein